MAKRRHLEDPFAHLHRGAQRSAFTNRHTGFHPLGRRKAASGWWTFVVKCLLFAAAVFGTIGLIDWFANR